MKRIAFYLISLMLIALINIPVTSYAQKGFNIGFNCSHITDKLFGFEFPVSNITDEPNFSVNFLNGYSYGLTFRYGFNKKYGLSTGITKGYRKIRTTVTSAGIGTMSTGEVINMLEIPFKLTHQTIMSSKGITLNSFIGGTFTFIETTDYESTSYSPSTNIYMYTFTNIQQQNNILKGIVYGTGIEKNFGEYGNIYAGITFHYQPAKNVQHYSFYNTGIDDHHSINYFRASFLTFDFIYYLPWRALTGEKASEN